MQMSVIGLFPSYAQAETAVLDLEAAGIVGEQVEMISDPARDRRAEELGVKPRETVAVRVVRGFLLPRKDGTDEVHDDPGDMSNYIGEQEFYATHVRSQGAILVVRASSRTLASTAEAILRNNGSKGRDGKAGVINQE